MKRAFRRFVVTLFIAVLSVPGLSYASYTITTAASGWWGLGELSINSQGDLVWADNGGIGNAEIYAWYGGPFVRLTDDDDSDMSPEINASGQIAWTVMKEDVYGFDIAVYRNSEIMSIPRGYYWPEYLSMSDSGLIAWQEFDGNDSEIFLYDGSSVIQLTDNEFDDVYPSMNIRGEIVWTGYNGSHGEIFLYNGSKTIQLTNNDTEDNSCQINNWGNVVWAGAGYDTGGDYEIYLYNGKTIVKLTDNDLNDHTPQISNNGHIAWCSGWVGDYNTTNVPYSEIFLYDGSGTIQLTHNDYSDYQPKINDQGQVIWQGDAMGYEGIITGPEVFVYDGSETVNLSQIGFGHYPVINSRGRVAWIEWIGTVEPRIHVADPDAEPPPTLNDLLVMIYSPGFPQNLTEPCFEILDRAENYLEKGKTESAMDELDKFDKRIQHYVNRGVFPVELGRNLTETSDKIRLSLL